MCLRKKCAFLDQKLTSLMLHVCQLAYFCLSGIHSDNTIIVIFGVSQTDIRTITAYVRAYFAGDVRRELVRAYLLHSTYTRMEQILDVL